VNNCVFDLAYELYKYDIINSVDIFARFLTFEQFKKKECIYKSYLEKAELKIRKEKLNKIKNNRKK
jgi:hypothetical protein